MSRKKIMGDYQTPLPLVRHVVSKLFADGRTWERILEPTCGLGNFIRVCIEQTNSVQEIIGLEIQQHYVQQSKNIHSERARISIHQQDIFEINLATSLQWNATSPLLIIGNPPWITNSEQGRLNGRNLPSKSNFRRLPGYDAITGKSNFDVAEAIWLKLINDFVSDPVTIALLCKTSVARKVAQYALQHGLPVNRMSLYHIDAQKWFSVAVDACLFTLELNQGDISYDIVEYDNLSDPRPARTFGFLGRKIVADFDSYRHVSYVEGNSQFVWRQGVKHDAAKVMEVTYQDGRFKNGYGNFIDIEGDYLYPLIKSSDVSSITSGFVPRKYIVVTQKQLGQQTANIKDSAPKLWRYLNMHANKLDARKSIIYKNAPRFSMFGIGNYSFAPYKVVVSGFYLPARFVAVSSYNSKQFLTDDTCYFLSFQEEWKSLIITALLNHPTVSKFLSSITFRDSKRPITKSVLERINLKAVYGLVNIDQLIDSITGSNTDARYREGIEDVNQLGLF